MSRVLVVIASAFGASARNGVDAALAGLAYEHDVSVLLAGDGVFLVAPGPRDPDHGRPQLSRALAACVHHGLTALVASEACLRIRGITNTEPVVQRMAAAGLSSWIRGHDHVHRF